MNCEACLIGEGTECTGRGCALCGRQCKHRKLSQLICRSHKVAHKTKRNTHDRRNTVHIDNQGPLA